MVNRCLYSCWVGSWFFFRSRSKQGWLSLARHRWSAVNSNARVGVFIAVHGRSLRASVRDNPCFRLALRHVLQAYFLGMHRLHAGPPHNNLARLFVGVDLVAHHAVGTSHDQRQRDRLAAAASAVQVGVEVCVYQFPGAFGMDWYAAKPSQQCP